MAWVVLVLGRLAEAVLGLGRLAGVVLGLGKLSLSPLELGKLAQAVWFVGKLVQVVEALGMLLMVELVLHDVVPDGYILPGVLDDDDCHDVLHGDDHDAHHEDQSLLNMLTQGLTGEL